MLSRSPQAPVENESHNAMNRRSAANVFVLAMIAGVFATTRIEMKEIAQAVSAKQKQSESTEDIEDKVLGGPFVLQIPISTGEHVSCTVSFLHDGFDVQVNECIFRLQSLTMDTVPYTSGYIQAQIPGGITEVECDAEGIRFHAGKDYMLSIEGNDVQRILQGLMERETARDVRYDTHETFEDIAFTIKMPPVMSGAADATRQIVGMAEWCVPSMKSMQLKPPPTQGTCSIQLKDTTPLPPLLTANAVSH